MFGGLLVRGHIGRREQAAGCFTGGRSYLAACAGGRSRGEYPERGDCDCSCDSDCRGDAHQSLFVRGGAQGGILNVLRADANADKASENVLDTRDADDGFELPRRTKGTGVAEEMLETFVREWKSHGTPVKGYANLFYGQFIVLMADESATGVSGCSTDSSVHLIKEIENRFGINLFDRLMLAFRINDKVQMVPLSQLPYALENGFVNADTLYFNNTVQTKVELEGKWLIPVKDSWLADRYLKTTAK